MTEPIGENNDKPAKPVKRNLINRLIEVAAEKKDEDHFNGGAEEEEEGMFSSGAEEDEGLFDSWPGEDEDEDMLDCGAEEEAEDMFDSGTEEEYESDFDSEAEEEDEFPDEPAPDMSESTKMMVYATMATLKAYQAQKMVMIMAMQSKTMAIHARGRMGRR
ncbi:hypothetical protein LTR62_000436 [Meristemomyces frigidus]|uniref:Uncharacterized protein n=1 Tax=Meristemomyces frigidus TaxID=1508187 RepID=A0AAN7TU18_9PEZI|nr:hypothetical protein LTR62_000436 [Meristemomyces frigidus]